MLHVCSCDLCLHLLAKITVSKSFDKIKYISGEWLKRKSAEKPMHGQDSIGSGQFIHGLLTCCSIENCLLSKFHAYNIIYMFISILKWTTKWQIGCGPILLFTICPHTLLGLMYANYFEANAAIFPTKPVWQICLHWTFHNWGPMDLQRECGCSGSLCFPTASLCITFTSTLFSFLPFGYHRAQFTLYLPVTLPGLLWYVYGPLLAFYSLHAFFF